MGKRGKLPKNDLPVASTPCYPSKPSKAELDRERRYRAEDGLRSLQRADEVKNNSELMGDIKTLAKEQMAALKKIK